MKRYRKRGKPPAHRLADVFGAEAVASADAEMRRFAERVGPITVELVDATDDALIDARPVFEETVAEPTRVDVVRIGRRKD